MALKQNTWTLNQWYDQDVAGNVSYSSFATGGMWSWGDSYRGQIGQNNSQPAGDISSPTQIPGTDWADLANTTSNMGAGITRDGELWIWGGTGEGGEFGQNDTVGYSSPVQVPGTTWAAKSDEEFGGDRCKVHLSANTMAIKTDGTLWVWGWNQTGAVANNSNGGVAYSSPVQIGSATTWKYVSSMSTTMGAIKTDGTLWMWGKSHGGRMGNNESPSNTAYSSPVQIPGTTWRTLSLANFNVFGTKTDGTLWSWGYNVGGTMGQNQAFAQLTGFSSPTQLPGTDWKQCSAGTNDDAAAVKTDGTLWTWGRNEVGLLGLNQAHDLHISSPTQVPGSTWKNVEFRAGGMYATKTDGTLWAWGDNAEGDLGQNNLINRSSPVQIPGTTWKRIAGTNASFGYATKS